MINDLKSDFSVFFKKLKCVLCFQNAIFRDFNEMFVLYFGGICELIHM